MTPQALIEELARAWNAGDACAFAAPFAPDAQQVNIFGARLNGRDEIREQHNRIFKTIFRGSTNTLRAIDSRPLGQDVLWMLVSSIVNVREGPLRGELRTLASAVLRKTGDARWEIVLFHNTRQQPFPPSST